MRITHGQYIIEIVKEDNGYYATANKPYDRGCTGLVKDSVYDAIFTVVANVDRWDADNWYQDYLDSLKEDEYMYWAYEQNRAEDPEGYKEFCERVKRKAAMKEIKYGVSGETVDGVEIEEVDMTFEDAKALAGIIIEEGGYASFTDENGNEYDPFG